MLDPVLRFITLRICPENGVHNSGESGGKDNLRCRGSGRNVASRDNYGDKLRG